MEPPFPGQVVVYCILSISGGGPHRCLPRELSYFLSNLFLTLLLYDDCQYVNLAFAFVHFLVVLHFPHGLLDKVPALL